LNSDRFLTHTLQTHPQGEAVARILAAAVEAVEPGRAVEQNLGYGNNSLTIFDSKIELSGRVFALGIGKAAMAMTRALARILGPRLDKGLVVTKRQSDESDSKLEVILGGHPLPDERSLAAGKRVEEFIGPLKPDDVLFCLISGGGSALVSLPKENVSLQDMQSLTSMLLSCGARVDEINTLRRKIDSLKGGGLARMAFPAQVVSLILSDVVGNPLEAIASGPTVPDPTTPKDALAVLKRYNLEHKCPASIVKAIKQDPLRPRQNDSFEHVHNFIVGSNLIAAQSALKESANAGFHPYLLRTDLQGEARDVARDLSIELRWAWKMGDPMPRPACIIAGGETTVTVQGDGRGGRNTELALAAVSELADFPEVMLVTLASDGEDGDTDAAGAVITGETWRRGLSLDMNSTEFLNRNDSYSYFSALGDLLKPGSTGTNVNDLTFLFTF
jgi:glycerate 2-kinase